MQRNIDEILENAQTQEEFQIVLEFEEIARENNLHLDDDYERIVDILNERYRRNYEHL